VSAGRSHANDQQIERGRLRADIERLRAVERALEEAQTELEHELRRAGDALARGPTRPGEHRLRRIRDNLELNRRDLERNRAGQRALEQRLATLEGMRRDGA